MEQVPDYGRGFDNGIGLAAGPSSDQPPQPLAPETRREGFHHEHTGELDEHRGRRPEGGAASTVIVNYLPPSLTEAEFHGLFAPFGDIFEAKIVRNHRDGRSLGYGFVSFVSDEAARAAIMAMNGYEARGKRLKVSISLPQSKMSDSLNVFISGFPRSYGEAELASLATGFGEIVNCKVLRDAAGNYRGTGFVRFVNRKDGETAIMSLHGKIIPLTESVRAYYLEHLGEDPPVDGFVLNVEVAESSKEDGKARARRARAPMDRAGGAYPGEPGMMPHGYVVASPHAYPPSGGPEYGHGSMRAAPVGGVAPGFVGYSYFGYDHHGGMIPQPLPGSPGVALHSPFYSPDYRSMYPVESGYGGGGRGGGRAGGPGRVGGEGFGARGEPSLSSPAGAAPGMHPPKYGYSHGQVGEGHSAEGSFAGPGYGTAHPASGYDYRGGHAGGRGLDAGAGESQGRAPGGASAMYGASGDASLPTSGFNGSSHGVDAYGAPAVGSGRPEGGQTPSASLFVFDLPSGGDEEMLLNLFSPYGRIESVRVIRGPDGRGKGYGFVNMNNWQEATAAVQALNGRKVGGCTLQVSFKR